MSHQKVTIGFLVKPNTRTIEALQFVGECGFRQIAGAIASGSGYVDVIPVSEAGDVIYVDDEGRINGGIESRGRFWIRGSEGCACAVGNGLLFGTDVEGETIDPDMALDAFTAMVLWEQPADCDDDGTRTGFTFTPFD